MPSNAFAARNAYLQFLKKTKPDIPEPGVTRPKTQVKKFDAPAAVCEDVKLDSLLLGVDSRHQRDFDDGGSITDSLTSEDTKVQEEDEVVSTDDDRTPVSPGAEGDENQFDSALVTRAVDQAVETVEQKENAGTILMNQDKVDEPPAPAVEPSPVETDAPASVSVERPINLKEAKCDHFDQDIEQKENAETMLMNQEKVDEPPAPAVEPHSPAQETVKKDAVAMHIIPPPPSSPVSAITPDYGFKHLKIRAAAIVKIQRFWRMKRMLSQNKELATYTAHLEQKYGLSFEKEQSLSKSDHHIGDSIQQEGETMLVVDNLPTVQLVESGDFESLCETSTCSFEDIVHDILMESGKWMYERVCDPLDDDLDDDQVSNPVQQPVDVQVLPECSIQGQQQKLRSVPASLSPDTITGSTMPDETCEDTTTGSTIPGETSEYKNLKTRAAAITKIQIYWRMKRMLSQNREFSSYNVRVCNKSAAHMQVIIIRSAIKIQAKWRKYAARTRFVSIISAIKVQSQWRRYEAKQYYSYLRSIIKVQAQWRSYQAKRDYTYIRSTIKVQAKWRSYQAKRHYTYLRSIIKVQAQWKSYQAKRDYTNIRSIIKVQAQWRSYQASRKFELFLGAVIVLQSITRAIPYRNFIAHKTAVKKQRLKAASTRIQTLYRGYSTRCMYDLDEIVYQIIVFQSLFRRMKAIEKRCDIEELNYLLMVALVRKIQRAYRNYKHGSTITKRLLSQRRQNYGDYNEERAVSANKTTYTIDFEEEFESKCCNTSRCGLDDTVHEILMESGRWMYELVGDPLDVDTAENLISIMEIGEEASGCLCWKHATDEPRNVHNAQAVRRSSVVVIQSKWRQYIAAKKVCSKKRRALLV